MDTIEDYRRFLKDERWPECEHVERISHLTKGV